MVLPILSLSPAARIELSDIAVAITVITGTEDHQAVEQVFTRRHCQILYEETFHSVTLVDSKTKGDRTVYLGVCRNLS